MILCWKRIVEMCASRCRSQQPNKSCYK